MHLCFGAPSTLPMKCLKRALTKSNVESTRSCCTWPPITKMTPSVSTKNCLKTLPCVRYPRNSSRRPSCLVQPPCTTRRPTMPLRCLQPTVLLLFLSLTRSPPNQNPDVIRNLHHNRTPLTLSPTPHPDTVFIPSRHVVLQLDGHECSENAIPSRLSTRRRRIPPTTTKVAGRCSSHDERSAAGAVVLPS